MTRQADYYLAMLFAVAALVVAAGSSAYARSTEPRNMQPATQHRHGVGRDTAGAAGAIGTLTHATIGK